MKAEKKTSLRREEIVNPMGLSEAPSKSMTQISDHILATDTSHLMEKIVEHDNIKKALKRVENNKGAPGVDKMKVEELGVYLNSNWKRIKRELLEGIYQPAPVRRVEIPKQDGGARLLGIPTGLDRLIQQATQQVLTPIFEQTFSECSYGFRPGKSARQAVYKAQDYINNGKKIVVDIDLEKFFDKVNHDLLMTKVAKHIHDKRVHILIRNYLQSGVMINGCCVASEEGTPQGGPISPLLANIMLNDLDKELEAREHAFVRYADDCNIYVSSQRAGERVYASIKKFIQERLKLKVNEEKSAVDCPNKRKFLGFSFWLGEEVKLGIAPRTKAKFKNKIRELTKRNWSISMKERIRALNAYILGWGGYFGIAQTKSVFQKLDEWIRRRLRMCLLKQWKLCKTRLSNLMRLGISEKWAGRIAFSRKGPWRLSNTPQMSKALNLAYWQDQGLVKLVDRHCEMMLKASL